jgi:hypothetical protein
MGLIMAYDVALGERVRAALAQFPLLAGETLGETKMFGGLCFTLNGKMLVGIDKTRLVVRLGDADYRSESEAGRALPMDLTGRPLRNFAYLAPGSWDTDADLLAWASKSAAFVREHMLTKPTKGKKR